MQLTILKGVGPKIAALLKSIGIESIEDVLLHLPLRYQDKTRVIPIIDCRPGDHAVIEGEITANVIKFAGKRQLNIVIEDAHGSITLRFFYFSTAQQKKLSVGTKLRCYGEVKLWRYQLLMNHPEYKILNAQAPSMVADSLTPIYATTEGLQQYSWQNLSQQALCYLQGEKNSLELLPIEFRQKYALTDIHAALSYVHRPPPDTAQDLLAQGLHPMQQRLAFEELLAHQMSLRQLRQQQQQHQAYPCPLTNNVYQPLEQTLLHNLGFKLTPAQTKTMGEIQRDLARSQPMLRLLQGDVGSGKTVVAAIAALQVIACGHQVVLMAPTELLAEQHFQQFQQWFMPLDISIAYLSGRLTATLRRQMNAQIADGTARLVVGTHALFQKEVVFHDVGLIIVDEQHRFGVEQRSSLREKGLNHDSYPHQLIMTATPIPRTLAMSVYADLDLSVIDALPPGRTPIKTVIVNNARRTEVIERVEQLVQGGGQVYWVCPLIEESEVLECESAEKIAEHLQTELPALRIGLVHGRLKADQKQQVMQSFKKGEIDILVATTVIEVGINVPNASLMVVENPERMGLAQLHQLRGRVGRGTVESHCILLYQEPLSETARKRLSVMRESTDGFYIAQQDLELRGPGEVLGTRQTGMQSLRIADVMRDRKLLPKVQQAAQEILRDYPDVVAPLIKRWIGEKVTYAKV